jgi:glycosyltransferase involved in cell wall biosynthesis
VSSRRRGILFLHGADEWYGSDVVLHDIVRGLEGSEFDPYVVVPDDIVSELPEQVRLSGRLREIGVPVVSLPLAVLRRKYMTPGGMTGVGLRLRTSPGRVLRTVDAGTIDIVHSHTATVLTGALVAAKLQVPHVWHVSEIVEHPRIMRFMLAHGIAHSADRIVAVSGAVRDHLAATVPTIQSKCTVIFNAVDTDRFGGIAVDEARARLGLEGTTVVGMIGRVGTMKGQEILLAAAPAVLRAHPRTTFLLVGGVLHNHTADIDKLAALATSLGVQHSVRILGYNADVATVLAAMDVVVQPSVRPESFGMTVIEAMACGKPVVAAAHGGALETVCDGVTGVLVPPRDSVALATALNTLLADPALRVRMGRAGQQRARVMFSKPAFEDAYLRLYRGICPTRVSAFEPDPDPTVKAESVLQ